ncbi:hypothetical protein BZG05_16315 [Salinivibrio kushneri]|nr:hypothetical protein BZG05_16315 [Salinivibrio kushneri]
MVSLLVYGLVVLSILYIVVFVLSNAVEIDVSDLYLIKTYNNYGIVRTALLFDEPLSMGLYFFLGFVLSELLRIRAPYKYILLLGSLCSFSLTAYVLVVSYYLVRSTTLGLKRVKTYLSLMLLFICLASLVLFFSERIQNIADFSEGSTRIRLALSIMAINTFVDNWFLGVGIGNSAREMLSYTNQFSSSINFEVMYSSNFYFSILAEFGIIGGVFFSFFVISVLKDLKNRVLFSGFVALLVYFLASSVFLSPIIWVFLLVCLLCNRESDESSNCRPSVIYVTI